MPIQVTYAVFEGKVIRTPFKVVSSKETKAVGPQHKLCSFLSFRHIKKLPATADLRVVMEVLVLKCNEHLGANLKSLSCDVADSCGGTKWCRWSTRTDEFRLDSI